MKIIFKVSLLGIIIGAMFITIDSVAYCQDECGPGVPGASFQFDSEVEAGGGSASFSIPKSILKKAATILKVADVALDIDVTFEFRRLEFTTSCMCDRGSDPDRPCCPEVFTVNMSTEKLVRFPDLPLHVRDQLVSTSLPLQGTVDADLSNPNDQTSPDCTVVKEFTHSQFTTTLRIGGSLGVEFAEGQSISVNPLNSNSLSLSGSIVCQCGKPNETPCDGRDSPPAVTGLPGTAVLEGPFFREAFTINVSDPDAPLLQSNEVDVRASIDVGNPLNNGLLSVSVIEGPTNSDGSVPVDIVISLNCQPGDPGCFLSNDPGPELHILITIGQRFECLRSKFITVPINTNGFPQPPAITGVSEIFVEQLGRDRHRFEVSVTDQDGISDQIEFERLTLEQDARVSDTDGMMSSVGGTPPILNGHTNHEFLSDFVRLSESNISDGQSIIIDYRVIDSFGLDDEFAFRFNFRDRGSIEGETVLVPPVNVTVDEDSIDAEIVVLANAIGNNLRIQPINSANVSVGSAQVSPTGDTILFTPPENFNTPDVPLPPADPVFIEFTVEDTVSGTTDTSVATIRVTPINDPPIASDDGFDGSEEFVVPNPGQGSQVKSFFVLDNDLDPVEGDPLEIVSTDGLPRDFTYDEVKISWEPNDSANIDFGIKEFSYTVCDQPSEGQGQSDCDDAIVRVKVNSPPQVPEENISVTTQVNTPVEIDILQSITDRDGDLITISSIGSIEEGVSVEIIEEDGSQKILYTPEENFTGFDRFTYQVRDIHGGFAGSGVIVEIIGELNAHRDTASTLEDEPVLIDVLANDSDIEDRSFFIRDPGSPVNGEVSRVSIDNELESREGIEFIPALNFNGEATFTYTIENVEGDVSEGVVTVLVEPVNDSPEPMDDSVILNPLSPEFLSSNFLVIPVLENDIDVDDGDLLILGEISTPSSGIGRILPNVSGEGIAYSPARNANTMFVGTDEIPYEICDRPVDNPDRLCGNAIVKIDVLNIPPEAQDDLSIEINEGQSRALDILENDTDPNIDVNGVRDRNRLRIGDIVSQPNFGRVVIRLTDVLFVADNNINFSGSGNLIQDSFSYAVSDGRGGSDTANVFLQIRFNIPPLALNDFATTRGNQSRSIDVLRNDSDPEGSFVGILPLNISTQFGTARTGLDCAPNNFACLFNSNIKVIYTPNVTAADFANNSQLTDTFSYTIQDAGGKTAIATVTVTITEPNNAPRARFDRVQVRRGQSVFIDVLSNDSDLDNDPLTITSTSSPPARHGSTSIVGNQIRYTHDGSDSVSDYFGYLIRDPKGATGFAAVGVEIVGNSPPVANRDFVFTPEDRPVIFDPLANDRDDDGDLLTLLQFTQPANGTLTRIGQNLIFRPNLNFNGQTGFTYFVGDGNTGVDQASVTITVDPVNDLPIARFDSATTNEDTSITIPVLANDDDVDLTDTLRIRTVTNGANGTTTRVGKQIRYAPNANYNGSDSFIYTACDNGTPSLCSTALVQISINSVDDTPVLGNIPNQSVTETGFLSVFVSCTDADGDSLNLSASGTPTGASFADNGNGTGTLSYNPNQNVVVHPSTTRIFSGVTVTCSDAAPPSVSDSFSITVNDLNRNPNANPDSATTDEDTPVVINVTGNDTDLDGDTLTVNGLTQGSNGSVSCGSSNCTYSPNPGFVGGDSFTYTVRDDFGGTDSASVSITVEAGNSPPTAVNDMVTTERDTSVVIEALANDTDPDFPSETLEIVSTESGPSNGSVQLVFDAGPPVQNGPPFFEIIYTPNSGFTGTDTFEYTIEDSAGNQDQGFISVTVIEPMPMAMAFEDRQSFERHGLHIPSLPAWDVKRGVCDSVLNWNESVATRPHLCQSGLRFQVVSFYY